MSAFWKKAHTWFTTPHEGLKMSSAKFGTPRIEQGQIVERSYGWCDGAYYMRVHDRSDGTTKWYRADEGSAAALAVTSYDAGGANLPPRIDEWIPCDQPIEDE